MGSEGVFRVFDEFPSGWNELLVSEVCEINPTQIGKSYPHSEIIYVDISSVSRGKLISTQRIPIESAPSRAKRIVKDGDTIISTVRVYRKSYYYVKDPPENTIVSTGFVVIRPKKADKRFIYYLLTSDQFIDHLAANSTGSAYPAFNPEIIERTLIPLPPLPEQRKIAEILGALDDKIELNYEMNKTLEAIAQAIFKHWFVDFEPFKDNLVYNEEIGKEIPEGWEVVKLGEVCKVYGGGTPNTNNPEYWEGGKILWATPTDITSLGSPVIFDTERKITEKGLKNSSAKLLPSGTILMTSRATIGYFAIAKKPISTNQGILSIVCNEYPSNYFILHTLYIKLREIKQVANGSTYPEVSRSYVRNLKILLPPRGVLNKFNELVEPIYKQISENEQESRILTQIRDTLLPKLLSGEIRVKVEEEFWQEVKQLENINRDKVKI
ncbi:MAG TPA: restriction endonuclease subunit S [Candidatus Syntrophoarchaeum butanivorans]|uniref:Restriction endonuclease subunit S n=1 Tax=Candidatus Syntropharchaeum butanivorans TaxID=1839936 RepID=A0A1F2P499_9EURY|nr:MAG: type I restriction endonuclease subunit S [Candidatus Syntrophoarchaeum butanivorans]HEC57418.1 restriction endonuclease subunit S [Candidatus Syntrophoarchaeum butanivorans]